MLIQKPRMFLAPVDLFFWLRCHIPFSQRIHRIHSYFTTFLGVTLGGDVHNSKNPVPNWDCFQEPSKQKSKLLQKQNEKLIMWLKPTTVSCLHSHVVGVAHSTESHNKCTRHCCWQRRLATLSITTQKVSYAIFRRLCISTFSNHILENNLVLLCRESREPLQLQPKQKSNG